VAGAAGAETSDAIRRIYLQKYGRPPQEQQQESASMDDTTAAKWNAWADDRILRQLQPAFDGAAVGAGEMHRKLEKQIADLRLEVEALRTELNLSKAHNVTRLREAG
jgi:hypothetical protein